LPDGVDFVVETTSVELLVPPAVRATVTGLNEAVGPPAATGVIEAERFAPVVRPELPSSIVDDPLVPATMLPLEGTVAIVKFPVTITLSIVECRMLPLVAVIVMEYVPANVNVVVEMVTVEVFDTPNPND
jgi:hypothetical protein